MAHCVALFLLALCAVFAAVLCIRLGYPRHPRPLAEHGLLGCFRIRLPALPNGRHPGPMVQLTYPATGGSRAEVDFGLQRYFRPPAIDALARLLGFPRWFARLVILRRAVDPPRPLADDSVLKVKGWPVVIFSSGLNGCLEMYTQLCREIAAAGAIVVAVEHEDGSGAYAESACTGGVVQYKKPPAGYNFSRRELIKWRRPFLKHRARELRSVVAYIRQVRRQSAQAAEQMRGSAHEDRTNHALFRELMARADPEALVLVGHSFGAAGILVALQQGLSRSVRGALLYDPWLGPVPDSMIRSGIPVRYAVVLSDEWESYGKEVDRIRALAKGSRGCQLLVACVAGTRHQWISDAVLWLPQPILRRMRTLGPASRKVAHAVTTQATHLVIESLFSETGLPCEAGSQLATEMESLEPKGALRVLVHTGA